MNHEKRLASLDILDLNLNNFILLLNYINCKVYKTFKINYIFKCKNFSSSKYS